MRKSKKQIISSCISTVLFLALIPNIYFIADKMGIQLAPGWYQDIVNWISAGGTIATAFAVVAEVTVPAWIAEAALAFGVAGA